ncbi:hypothetical protein GW15_0212350 [Xanthomonas axonopodis pv. vasculorum]|uniref:Ubiquitin-like protease family profile domain-containing protein n=1 Tax=Xanthomonas axonopodis pv. vasculorum TaxID=325777 RepID=A0A098PXJ1_9XANT|nr:Ulp1 family isopeptidase [Xanthomonas axonopodis]KGE51829.1 hypothetical protein GW15_0212350 [Xanthomonas axonopodis pv. vasculorum]
MHPLLESLPQRNPTQVHADNSVHRMRVAAPASKIYTNISKILNVIETYGDGESLEKLKISFPGFTRFLSNDGLSRRLGMQLFQQINEDQRDLVIHQIIRRISNRLDPEIREIALSNLELACSGSIVLSRLARGRIVEAKAKAEAAAKAKTKTKTKAKAKYDPQVEAGSKVVISEIMEYLPRYEILDDSASRSKFHHYLGNDGSYGKALLNILPFATTDQKERLDLAIERRKVASARSKGEKKKYEFMTLYRKPSLLLQISNSFSSGTCSITEASSGYLSEALLEKLVDQETGELTRLGEEVISGASEGMQAAIRANFRLRYRQTDLPPNSTPQAFHRPEETWNADTPGVSSYSSMLPPTPSGGWPQNTPGDWNPDSPGISSYSSMFPPTPSGGWPQNTPGDWNPDSPGISSYSSMFPPTPSGGWPQNTPGEWNPDTPAGSSYRSWSAQPEASSSTFDGLDSLDYRPNYGYREFDLNTPQGIEQPGWQCATPAQSTDSTFDGLSSMSRYGREFDLNTPQEEEEPWDDGTQTLTGYSAMSPERVDVDNLPSPQDVADPDLPPATGTSWLLDGHLRAYTDELARRLRGQPNAHLLHFADSQVVTMLSSADPDQQARARRLLVGDDVPPIMFLPINQPNAHWSLLVVDRRNKDAVATYHYDSMAQKQPQQRYLADMAAYHLGLDYEKTLEMPTARQTDGYSCGDHVLTGIEMLAHRVIDGTFDHAGGRDLSGIEPDRGLIRNRLAQAAQAPAESSVRSAPERPIEQKNKKSKWWEKF